MRNFLQLKEFNCLDNLKNLYKSFGLKRCRLKRFEEYDFYADKKDFIQQKFILTFNDLNGQLMALRPDVTLSVIRKGLTGKFFYLESVYRPSGNRFAEIKQAGVEFLGSLNDDDLRLLCSLALDSLKILAGNNNFILDVADASLCNHLTKAELSLVQQRNIDGLRKINASDDVINLLHQKSLSDKYQNILNSLASSHLNVDYSAVSNLNYYNGLVFKGYIDGCPHCVLSGGQYDGLLRSMKSDITNGAGFAVYLEDFDYD